MTIFFRRLSAAGRAAIILGELRGAGSGALLQRFVAPQRLRTDGRAQYVQFVAQDGVTIDDGMVIPLAGCGAPEEGFLLSLHGNPLFLEKLFAGFESWGAARGRADAPFDLFPRASSRIALEAYERLARARSGAGVAFLLEQAELGLGAWADHWREAAQPPARAELIEVVARAHLGRALFEPKRVVLAGVPNAGKSTLFNALLGRERVVTHAEPGTTRDRIEEETLAGEFPIQLVDGAGLRETTHALEQEAVRRMEHAIRGADLILWLRPRRFRDSELERRAAVSIAGAGRRVVAIESRADESFPEGGGARASMLRVSAKTGEGMQALEREIQLALFGQTSVPADVPVPFCARQEDLLRESLRDVEQGRSSAALEKLKGL